MGARTTCTSDFDENEAIVTAVRITLQVLLLITSFFLTVLILLHKGRGGGLSDMFGGGLGATAAGSTVVEKNLDRITLLAALLFTISSVSLAFLMDK